MVDTLWLALLAGGLGCLLLMLKNRFKIAKLPPGPKGWPLVGNAFQQDPIHPYMTWSSWAKEYGDVYTIDTFGSPTVVCNSFEGLWEMLVSKSNDFAGRPQAFPMRHITFDGASVTLADFSPHWAYRKKVFITSIKMYGDGLVRLENIMGGIVADLMEEFQETKQQPFDPYKPIQMALCNTLALLLLGDRFDYTDADFHQLLHYIKQTELIAAPSMQFFLLDKFPWLRYIPLPYCKLMDSFVNGLMRDWIPRMIQRRMVHYDENNPTCVLDSFIKQHETDTKTKAQNTLEKTHVEALFEDVFVAGMVTSSTAMYSFVAILTAKQDIQDKLRAEVDQVLGGRRPKLQDKQTMPYFLAVLEEILRYTVVATGLPHRATVDSSICGHNIPKGTQVWPNIWHLCHEPNFWGDPWTFRPERFLDESGGFVSADHPARKRVLVFGAGRRVCPGEQLARNRIFLITVSMVQNFVLKPAADDQLPECDPRTYPEGAFLKPQQYKIRAVPRE